MQITDAANSATLEYWLNWRGLISAIWVLAMMVTASYVMWKKEGPDHPTHYRRGTPQQMPQLFHDDDAWRTCLKEIHPVWLMAYRLVSFSLFSIVLVVDIVLYGANILFFYTQWTFALVTIFFGLGFGLSLYGCYQRRKIAQRSLMVESPQGSYFPLSYGEAISAEFVEDNSSLQEEYVLEAGIFGSVLQVLFQLAAGAVVLTDCVYWSIIYPFLSINDFDLNLMTYVMHSLNVIFLLGDTALNSLRFPWFRISYFVLWTGTYVIVQWIIHGYKSVRWPYPFLDLSSPFAPLWYIIVGLMQLPCYGVFVMFVEAKVSFFSRRFPQSCQCTI